MLYKTKQILSTYINQLERKPFRKVFRSFFFSFFFIIIFSSMAFTWHQQIPNDEDRRFSDSQQNVPLCSTSSVRLRFLCPDDLEEVRTLCQDWFPIDYPFSWYEDITSSTRFFALAAVYNLAIIGLIVAEIKPYSRLNKEDRDILSESKGKDSDVGYILSLGVHKNHRRNGIGSLLLDSLINHLTTSERSRVKAIYLHVLTTNQPAILFYERRRFRMHTFLPYYYSIKGNCKDGFAYVLYINGGHPPWTLIDYATNLCTKCKLLGSVVGWISTTVRSVWRWVCQRTIARFKFSL